MRAPSLKNMPKNIASMQGFTLLEIISVMVVLSVVAVMGSRFVMESTNAYQSTQTRSRLVNTGGQAVEAMSRRLRVALSYTVRITNSNMCLEYMPIVAGGNYIDPVPDAANGVAASATIAVSPHTLDMGTAQYASIGASVSTEIYGAAPISLATLSSRTAIQLTLSSAKTWQRNSLGQHFFLLDAPQAFCIVGSQLRFYTGQDVTSASVNTASAYSVMADNVTVTTPFSITSGSENRNTNILFNITFHN